MSKYDTLAIFVNAAIVFALTCLLVIGMAKVFGAEGANFARYQVSQKEVSEDQVWAHQLAANYAPYDVGDTPLPDVQFTLLPPGINAKFIQGQNLILISYPRWLEMSDAQRRETLVHEIIHWRQYYSGWATNRMGCQIERDAYIRSRRAVNAAGVFPHRTSMATAVFEDMSMCSRGRNTIIYTPSP